MTAILRGTRTPARDLEQPFRRLHEIAHRAEFDPAEYPELLSLARQAASASQHALAAEAGRHAALALACLGERPHALATLTRALRDARRAPDTRVEAGVQLTRMQVLQVLGDHDECVRGLLVLLGPGATPTLSAADRHEALLVLAGQCALVDTGSSTDRCLAMAARASREVPGGVPTGALLARSRIQLDRYLWSAPEFATLLHPASITAPEREALLFDVEACCTGILDRPHEQATPLAKVLARVHLELLAAVRHRDSWAALHAMELFKRGRVLNAVVNLDIRYQISAVLLAIGHPSLAGRIAAIEQRVVGPVVAPERRIRWLHLHSAISSAQHADAAARESYQRYAQRAAEHWQRMNLRTRELVASLDRGMSPSAPSPVQDGPGYLRLAVEILHGAAASGHRIASLASAVGVSERTLRDAFHAHLGMSPKQYEIQCRLERARDFVRSGAAKGLTGAEIAARLGFSNAGRFSALYRSRFGHAPQAGTD